MTGLLLIACLAILSTTASTGDLDVGEHDAAFYQKPGYFTPVYDKSLPQLFFCGDSISVGYAPYFKLALRGKINALHLMDVEFLFPESIKLTYSGRISSLREASLLVFRSGQYETEFMMLNSGLHDVQLGRPNSAEVLQRYVNELAMISDSALEEKVKIIWVTTTKVGSGATLMGKAEDTNRLIRQFNETANNLMTRRHHVIDLGEFSSELIAKHGEDAILLDGKVHFSVFAQQEQGRFLAREVMKIMDVQ